MAVAEGVRIRKVRRFPLTGDIEVKKGQAVQWNTLLGHQSAEEKLHMMRVESVDQKIAGAVVRQVGDSVKRGEAVALATFALGLGLTEYCSPVDGQIMSVDTITGTIVIREYPEPLRALMPGIVAQVQANEAVVIETVGTYIEGTFGSGTPNGGRLAVLASAPGATVPAQEITLQYAGKVAVIGAECKHEHLMAALKSRLVGVIAGGGDIEAIESFNAFVAGLDKEEYETRFGGARNVNVVWQEDDYIPGLTVILTEGFGHVPMRQQVFDALKEREGKYAFLDVPGLHSEYAEPAQVIIPEGDPRKEAPWLDRNLRRELRPGSRVRLIGASRYGETGVIEDSSTIKLVTGQEVPAFKVRLESIGGASVTVPRQNVEAIDLD
jgi:hypothetical protein